MTELREIPRKPVLALILVALLLPYGIEFEASGPLDARTFRTLISSMIWAIETIGFQSQLGSTETTQFLFPYCCLSAYAVILLLINLLLVILVTLCIDGKIGYRITIFALILSVVFPIILSGLVSILQVMVELLLLPIPAIQLVGLLLLRYTKSTDQ